MWNFRIKAFWYTNDIKKRSKGVNPNIPYALGTFFYKNGWNDVVDN